MRTILILLSVAISITFVNTERKSNFTKPVISLEKRPSPPVWNRPPEERRKLSIFPKTNMKFVVTPKTVQNDNQEGPTTKRPIMRKFVMQDKNEKGTWSFAPRPPLMKTKRFTVTLAPPKNQRTDEPNPDESRKINTEIHNLNKDHQPSKDHKNLNKGNLIDMLQYKKVNSAPKKNEKVDHEFADKVNPSLTMDNHNADSDIIQINQNKTVLIHNKNSEGNIIDERSFNDEKVRVKANETKNDHNLSESVELIKIPVTPDKKEDSEDVESRSIDLSELGYPIVQNLNNSLILNNEENDKRGQVLAFNDLEILFDKIVNNTEEFNVMLASDSNVINSTSVSNNHSNDTLEDVTQFDPTKQNTFYEVISVDDEKDKNKGIKEESPAAGLVFQHSLNMDSGEITVVSDTNTLNDEHLKENAVHLHIDHLENQKDELTLDHGKTVDDNIKEGGRDIADEPTGNLNAEIPYSSGTTSRLMVKETTDDFQKEQPEKLDSTDVTHIHSEEILLEVYESNRDLSSEESSAESFLDEDSHVVYLELVTESSNLTLEDSPNEARETSEESISNTLNNHTEELSNKPLIDVSDDLTSEAFSNESSSNIAAEELSNEYDVDKSNNLTGEISNESIIDSSNNFTEEDNSNISSSNTAGEELSNESNVDKSISLTEEVSNEFIIESSINFTGEEIANESSSNMAEEELSKESNLDKSTILTEEFSNESAVGASNNFTGEDISDEWLMDQSDSAIEELISDESVISSQDPIVEKDISLEALTNRFKRSINIIEEENLATTVSGLKYTGHVNSLNHDLSYKNINA